MKTDPFTPILKTAARSAAMPDRECLTPVPADAPPVPEKLARLGAPVARWGYRDASSNLLGYVCRFNLKDGGKEFRPLTCWRDSTGKVEWRWESWPAPRPLFGLDALASRPTAPVLIVEGEKCVEAARRMLPGYAVVTSPNGSQSTGKADWSPLRGRDVIVWPDHDAAGSGYADDVVKHCAAAGARTIGRLTSPGDMPVGWDAADAEAGGWSAADAEAFVAAAVPVHMHANASPTAKSRDDEKGVRKRPPAQRDSLMSLTEFCDLWTSPDGDGYATFPVGRHRENWKIRSERFRSWLSNRAFEELGVVPNSQSVEDTLRILQARASASGRVETPWRRVGRRDGRIFIDLCDAAWRVVEVTCDGWLMLDRHDLPFVRSKSMLPLPEPEPGYEIDLLRPFANTSTESDFLLAVSWLLTALAGVSPFMLLQIKGEQGTGKSTFATILRSLVDPNAAMHRSLPRDIRDLAVAAANSHVLSFDNCSYLDRDLADTLCRAATGSGFAARTLHSDSEETILKLLNPVILNGIPALAEQSDLADRGVVVTLRPITPAERRTEKAFMADWADAAPRVLGALLDGLSSGLRREGIVALPELPRMADFAEWVTACEPGIGLEPGTILREYLSNRKEMAENAFEAEPPAGAVYRLMHKHLDMLETSPSELLDDLAMEVSESTRKSRGWPSAPNKLRAILDRSAPLLRGKGIEFVYGHSERRFIRLYWVKKAEEKAA